MYAETVINQEAQEHAAACALFARLCGQLGPSCLRLPVLHKNLDEPPQRLALDPIQGPPTQVGGAQRAIGLLLGLFDRHDQPFGVVGTDVSPGTADRRHHRRTASDTDTVRRPRMGGKIVGNVWRTLADPQGLMATDWREDLHAPEQG